jgi:DNA-binding response OmpR family regulator/two-component sensor histidine kinase
MTVELEPVALGSLLSNSLTIVREKAATQGIRLDLELDEAITSPQLDVRKTKQIVYNLLSNAVKFSSSGGRVTLKASRVPRAMVGRVHDTWPVFGFPLADNEFDEFLELRVSDTGIGISPQNMAKLFQAFTQIDSSLSRQFEGTGLGLAMVKQLAELHGGSVAVSSAEGEGACFAAWLPLRQDAPRLEAAPDAALAIPVPVVDPALERFALVVEDDAQCADLVRLLLEAEGFSVLIADTAEAGLAIAQRQPLNLITLDIQLPGVDGWALLGELRESKTLADVPVVIISGGQEGNMGLNRGAAAVLQKPISRLQLNAALTGLGLQPCAAAHAYRAGGGRRPEGGRGDRRLPPASRLRGGARLRWCGGDRAGAEPASGPDPARPDDAYVDGFDVVEALQRGSATARIPILVVTAKHISKSDHAALNHGKENVIRIVPKAGFNRSHFMDEVRRALVVH